MDPSLTSSRPASIRSEVDLPQPDGPTSTMNSPSSISRLSLSTAGVSEPGYTRDAALNETVAMTIPSFTGRNVPDDPSKGPRVGVRPSSPDPLVLTRVYG